MTKILVVDDEPSIRNLVEMILKREKYTVATACDGKSALMSVREFRPDLVVLDLMLPDMNGHDVCRELRKDHDIPIIMLTAKNEVIDKVLGLELGADDYITKPFEAMELTARIKAVLRRLGGSGGKSAAIKYAGLEIDVENKTVYKNSQEILLTPKEYLLLELLALNPKKVFSRDDLLDKVWGYDYLGDSRVVDICVTRLRKKVEDDSAQPKHIVTVFGFGYRFGGA